MTTGKPIVFVVDDDPSVRRSLERLFRSAGIDVETFGSAKEFLARPTPPRPSCLCLDVAMPEMSGLELQQRIAGTDHDLPVVIITGHGSESLCAEAMNAGALAVLHKPLDRQSLLAAIVRAIEQDQKRVSGP